jgi:hypothetical protein
VATSAWRMLCSVRVKRTPGRYADGVRRRSVPGQERCEASDRVLGNAGCCQHAANDIFGLSILCAFEMSLGRGAGEEIGPCQPPRVGGCEYKGLQLQPLMARQAVC